MTFLYFFLMHKAQQHQRLCSGFTVLRTMGAIDSAEACTMDGSLWLKAKPLLSTIAFVCVSFYPCILLLLSGSQSSQIHFAVSFTVLLLQGFRNIRIWMLLPENASNQLPTLPSRNLNTAHPRSLPEGAIDTAKLGQLILAISLQNRPKDQKRLKEKSIRKLDSYKTTN